MSTETPLMKDRIALVTGGSRGIGAATAIQLAQHGAHVAINYYRNAEAAQSVVETIEKAGGKALAFQADVAKQEEVERMVSHVRETLGPIDTLVLNAPASSSSASEIPAHQQLQAILAPFTGSRWDVLEAFVCGQLQAAYYPSQAVLPDMIKYQRGSIIFVSATHARQPEAGGIAVSVAIAKSSVETLMQHMAQELGPSGIRVNTVGGGMILTDLNAGAPQQMKDHMAATTPLRRNGRPEDMASAIAYLASDQASFVTGAYLTVAGGNFII